MHDATGWNPLTRLYVLAEELRDTWAKNRTVDVMDHYFDNIIVRADKCPETINKF
jgi:predicted glycosyltransferase